MCGIIGYIGGKEVLPILLEGLHRLEYRGYDSAGVAVVNAGRLDVHKRCGKVRDLEVVLPAAVPGNTGIAHTRWATHGAPSDANAHPHTDTAGRVAIVHNGIIENAIALRSAVLAQGVTLASETDSELFAHLLSASPGETFADVARLTLQQITGTYGLLALDARFPGQILAARNGSPLIIGIGDGEMFVASDAAALVRYTRQVVYLDDGDVAVISADSYRIFNVHSQVAADRPTSQLTLSEAQISKGGYSHYMLKEIHDQSSALAQTLSGRLERRFATAHLGGFDLTPQELLRYRRIRILGCGSAFIAGQLGARLVERLSRVPCEAESAAEFRYRHPVIETDTLYIAVSQSGETFDTYAAVEEIKRKGGAVVGVINVVGSSIARACGRGVYLHAGPEVSVVASKTFTSTVAVFVLLALHLARMKDLSVHEGQRLIAGLDRLPDHVQQVLDAPVDYAAMGKRIAQFNNAYFVGRGAGFALAQEGALKLKEVSYVHAEAYPASELKHGPLALISPETLTVVVMPDDELLEKNRATIEEVRARRGPVLVINNRHDASLAGDEQLTIAPLHELLDTLVMAIPLQLLAYHAALSRGCEIDQPRNLAKSVTVE